MDTADPDDGRTSKNIIHQYPRPMADGTEMTSLWKRIDFGYESMRVDFDRLYRFLCDNKEDLQGRYETILLANRYLTEGKEMREIDIGRLDALVGEYRWSSLRHYVSRGLGIGEREKVYIAERTESLI